MESHYTRKLKTAIQVIECQLHNQNPCDVLDPKDVKEVYTNILNTLDCLATEGLVKWYHYFDDDKMNLEHKDMECKNSDPVIH